MASAVVRSLLNASKISANNKILLNSVSRGWNRFDVKNTRTLTRSFFYLCRSRDSDKRTTLTSKAVLSNTCGCGCSLHTEVEQKLVAFLEEEIQNELRADPRQDLPIFEDFAYDLNGAEVIFKRKMGYEKITIKTNINNSVEVDEAAVMDPNDPKDQQEQLLSKPEFTVEVQKGNKILSFLCTYSESIPDEIPDRNYADSFQISELSLYEGEFEDATYTVSGDIMDGHLYDLLMNYLHERGISTEFADDLVKFFTAYEHKLYINLLKGIKSFVEKQN